MTTMRAAHFSWLLVGGLCALALPAHAFDEEKADHALRFAQEQVNRTASRPDISPNRYPKTSTDEGGWTVVRDDDKVGWTQGFFPGLLWLVYEQSGEPTFKDKADAWTRPLEVQKTHSASHDVGFKFFPSYGQAYRLTGDPYYRDVLLTAAGSLAKRFDPTVGIINCCDWNAPEWEVPLVVDTMMNLELLFWGAQNGGDPVWSDMALSHAMKTLTDMVRPDGGTYHVVDYDHAGNIRSRKTFQGYADSSTWARGQAWAIYGYTMAYRYTRDPRMLEAAQKVTQYYLDRLPPDLVPYWDFDAPADQQVKDSSAAAVVASALLELSTFVTDSSQAERYHSAALTMLDSLSSPAYLAEGTRSPGILLHGVAFFRTPIKPTGDAIDKSLIYGDYYFVEALLRFKESRKPVPGNPEASASKEGQGCTAAPGGTLAVVGLMLWLLRSHRRSRVGA